MTHVAPPLALFLTSLLVTFAAADVSIFCTWTKVLPHGEVHLSFLRRSPSSLRLYHSSWSGEKPLGCAWSEDAPVLQNYLSLCRERARDFSTVDRPREKFDVESMLEVEGLCVSVDSLPPGVGSSRGRRSVRSGQGRAERSEVTRHERVKRGFIVPGTLWCGSGNKAPSYADLGVFSQTDSCCREHDQCKHTILSFHSEFGVFNSNIFTMSHCDCDNKFRSCLMEANDSISDVVGYTFFNLLKMHCFEFSHRLQCTERNWFGMCKETKLALYADVHPPTLYESPNPTEVSVNGTDAVLNATVPTSPAGSNTSHPPLSSNTSAASTVPTPLTSSPSASIIPDAPAATASETAPSGPASERRDDLENALTTGRQTGPELEADVAESCAVYKDLDECRNKILPQQRRYGLHNPEATTLYHCNCTSRLFQTLAEQRRPTELQALLLGRVSRSCFLPRDCTVGETCSAVLVKAQLPRLAHGGGGGADVEEQHHLQAVRLKVRRPNARRAKRKDRAVRLHKLCLRTVRARRNEAGKHTQ